MSSIHVLKFGGTSLQNAALINQAADIIAERKEVCRPVVVASAVGGVTDQLLQLAENATTDQNGGSQIIRQLKTRHLNLLDELSLNGHSSPDDFAQLFEELQAVFNDQKQLDYSKGAWRDKVLSFGERASVRLLEIALHRRGLSAQRVEAQHLIKTDDSFGEANVNSKTTAKQIREALASTEAIPVVTGFIGSTENGTITTLGRSGSDYTASLIAGALCADLLEIWTDVNGVLTADPKVVPDARSIELLSYDDIAELAAHGARVLHPKTIEPLRNCGIPVHVRNSLEPAHPGTQIKENFTSNGTFQSVTVSGPFVYLQMPGRFHSTFYGWLKDETTKAEINEIYSRLFPAEPSQFIIPGHLYRSLEANIQKWLEEKDIDADITDDLYQVKKFTNAFLKNDEVAANAIQILARNNIRPVEWHRGRNQRHVSLLLKRGEAYKAANLINNLNVAPEKTVNLFIAGIGEVGGTLLHQIDNLDHPDINLSLTGTCNTTNVEWFGPRGETEEKNATNWPAIIRQLKESKRKPLVFVDATGSEEVAWLYPQLLEDGIHIVTPSKLANTFEQSYYDLLREKADEGNAQFLYEPTAGAGLPVISTINKLQNTGDSITEISGAVSGTMTYLFDRLEKGIPFSEAIVDARKKGYAEPDPRDDLSGEDAARKFLTLAREIGLKMERRDLQVESLIPEELRSVDAETFLKRLSEFDDRWTRQLEQARENGNTLRYIGQLSDGEVHISVQEVPAQSPLGHLGGTDNLFRIFSKRYSQSPIIIQGPGAGKEVTAAGVLDDVLEVAAGIK